MSLVAAGVIGYLIGTIPTAVFLGRLFGLDLRRVGSGNPGTHNALRNSGPLLAALVLVVEAAKGLFAVWAGRRLGLPNDAEVAALVAGVGAVTGNVYNVWYRFQGGKGLGISLGVLIALWPWSLVPLLVVLVVTVVTTKSSGTSALAAIAALVLSSLAWWRGDWPTGGVETGPGLVVFAVGMAVVLCWKHWLDSPLSRASPRRTRERT
jgi:acyl phosphate:glycerol-3-phosphate acyltransferase